MFSGTSPLPYQRHLMPQPTKQPVILTFLNSCHSVPVKCAVDAFELQIQSGAYLTDNLTHEFFSFFQ